MDGVVENGKKQEKVEALEVPSPVDPGEEVSWKPDEEKALLRRIDLRILPGLSVLYLLCFLDRTLANSHFDSDFQEYRERSVRFKMSSLTVDYKAWRLIWECRGMTTTSLFVCFL